MLILEFADIFFSDLLEGEKWEQFEHNRKLRAMGTATMQINSLNLSKKINEDKFKQAICYQALYLLLNEDRDFYTIAEMNGWESVGTKDFNSNIKNRNSICKPAMDILKPFIAKVGRLRWC